MAQKVTLILTMPVTLKHLQRWATKFNEVSWWERKESLMPIYFRVPPVTRVTDPPLTESFHDELVTLIVRPCMLTRMAYINLLY